jgi:hypothetical protein
MALELLSGEELISGNLSLGADHYDDADAILSGVDIVGAQRAHAARRGGQSAYNQAMRTAAAYKQAQSGLVVREQNPTKARRLVLPMTSTGLVGAGTSATITARPQTIAFKPQRVTIPATIAPDFTIEDIKVGNKSQLAQSGSLPAEAFTQTSFGVEMDMDTVQTSQDFVIQLTNISGANRTFRAAVFGRAADY